MDKNAIIERNNLLLSELEKLKAQYNAILGAIEENKFVQAEMDKQEVPLPTEAQTMFYTIELPWPPSANRYWRHVNGRVLVSKEAKAYKKLVQRLTYLNGLTGKEFPLKERLGISINVYCPDKRKRDIDNLLKITIDSMQAAGIFENDCQIDKIFICRKPLIVKHGQLHVKITGAESEG